MKIKFTIAKFFLFFISLTTTVANLSSQNVGVNATGATPDVSAMLAIATTNKGFLIPSISLLGKIYVADLDTKTISDNKSIIICNTQAIRFNADDDFF